SFAEWLGHVATATGERPEAAAKAKAMCIELADLASDVAGKGPESGEMRSIAALATEVFLKRRGGQMVEQCLAEARQLPARWESPEGSGEGDDRLLRLLEARLRESGRA